MDDELCVTVVSKYKKLLHFDVLKLGQILCVDRLVFSGTITYTSNNLMHKIL